MIDGLGIVVPLDKSLPEQEIESLLQRSKADAVIFDGKYAETMKEMKKKSDTHTKLYICMGQKF